MTKDREASVSSALGEQLRVFLAPLLVQLDSALDKRLVRTFFALVQTIITHRHSTNGLLLSELGGYLLSPGKAPAGTKRISNLLRSRKWSYGLIERFLWVQAAARLDELAVKQDSALLVWDDSVWEKPESIAVEGLCAVRPGSGCQTQTDQERLLQSARSSYFCTRYELAGRCPGRYEDAPLLGEPEMVDDES